MNAVPAAEAAPRAGPALASVFAPLRPQMVALDGSLRSQIESFEPEIRALADYCVEGAGKRIRPALVFLSGWRGPEVVSPDLVRVATVVELVHLATLVHDDIMDEADLRRNRRTAARAYGPSAAVLLGDALFAHALHLATQFPTTEVCAEVSAATRRVCAGEIMQTLRRGTTHLALEDYHRIIDLKTAELFRVSCLLGARLAGFAPGYVEAVSRFGRHLGRAYQIYDDLADYFGEEKLIGKTLGTDLASGKLTLPLLALLERLPARARVDIGAEILGSRPPQLSLHLRQMSELGIFDVVAAAVQSEIGAAVAALQEWPGEPPTPGLLGLGDMLGAQLSALRPADA